jgi:hypothetical protein
MVMKIQVVVLSLLSGVEGYHCFGGLCCFHLHPEDALKCWYPTSLHGIEIQKTMA